MSLFLRDGNKMISLYDMQCSWYENERAAAHLRNGQHGKALKQFVAVTKHFHDMEEDQFDFHSYCLRKMTLRAYVKMMRMEDNIRSHRFFVRAARGVVQTYLAIFDSRALHSSAALTVQKELDENLDPAERKRLEKVIISQARFESFARTLPLIWKCTACMSNRHAHTHIP